MLSEAERQAAVVRITGNIEQFDDDTLLELERLTDPETHELGGERRTAESGLSRRQLIAGAVAGGVIITLGAAGGLAVVRGGTGDQAELDELRDVTDLYEELERVDMDGAVAAALGTYGSSVDSAQTTADELEAGLDLVDRVLGTAAVHLDPGVASALEQQVLAPGRKSVTELRTLGDSWVGDVQDPLEARLAARAEVRRRIDRATASASPTGEPVSSV